MVHRPHFFGRLPQRWLQRFNQVQVGECHGTGRALGDPIEIGAMKSVQCRAPEMVVLMGEMLVVF